MVIGREICRLCTDGPEREVRVGHLGHATLWRQEAVSRRPEPIYNNKEDPSFSPDGKWLAYDSDESGQWEVYIVPFPQGEGRWQVSTGGGQQPRWRRDAKELFYVGTGNRLMAAEVR